MAVKSEAVPQRERAFGHAAPDTVLMYGDITLVVGRINDVERFAGSA